MASINAIIRTQVPVRARTLNVGQSPKLIHLADIDSTELGEGALLIYNETTGKFQTKPELSNSSTIVNGGKY